jgi:hypothetical protein
MKTIVVFSIGIAILSASTGFSFASPPVVFWASDPVLPNDTVMAIGANMAQVQSVSVARLPDDVVAGVISAEQPKSLSWVVIKPLQVNATSCKFVVPANWKPGVYRYRLNAPAGDSPIQPINSPDVWWKQGDLGDDASPGGWLRVFGKCLNIGGTSRIELRSQIGRPILLKAAPSDGYSLQFSIPESLQPGSYAVRIHNGAGGNAAWSAAGTLNVRKPSPWPQNIYNVMDFYGASAEAEIERTTGKGSAAVDRTDAINAALKKAASNGGGIVFFPEGSYSYKGVLEVPANTVLRGAGMGLVSVWWGAGGYALDGGSNQRRLDDNYGAPPNLIAGGAYGLEDMTVILPRQYDVGISSGDNFEMQRVRIRVDRFWIRPGQREDGTTLRIGSNCRVTDCDILGKGVIFQFNSCHDDIIARNTISAGKSPFALERADGLIVEDNRVTSLDPTAYINLNNEGRDIYYARNHHEAEYSQQSDFSWTFDGYGVAYQGVVGAVDGVHLTLAKDPTYPSWASEISPIWHRAIVAILQGTGMGQYRFVASNNGRSIQIDKPFDISPDSTSVISIIPYRGHVLLIGNHFEDAGWVNLGYGTSVDVIAAGNSLYRVGQFLNLGLRDDDGVLPSWYVQFLNNDIYEGQTLEQTTGDERNGAVFSGTSTMGAVHRRTHYHADNGGVIDVGGNALDVVVEHNKLDNRRNTIKVDSDTNGVVVRSNKFVGAPHYGGDGLSKAMLAP